MTPLLRLDGVGKRFDNGLDAVADIDQTIADGSFVGLLGPSGCGKSTLLRLMAGLERPSAGAVRWAATADAATPTPRLGCVFQEPTLMPWASAFDNVYLPLRLAGTGRDAARPQVLAALGRVGLERFATARPHALSGGMRMRVSIARALVRQPRLLLMDEPFAALDELTREQLGADLLAIWREQRFAVVFVTHSVFESVFLAQRILVMGGRPGRIAAEIAVDGPPERGPDWRATPDYALQCAAVSRALRAATVAAATP